jgi:ribonuclease-3
MRDDGRAVDLNSGEPVGDFNELQSRLGYAFRDPALLKLALTHPSIAQDPSLARQHNQRLEFLGDAVLQLVLTTALYEQFPDLDEGSLTKARAQMVNRNALAARSRAMDLGPHLIVSRGEELHGGRARTSTLADALEALFGAVFVDGGFESARQVVLREFQKSFTDLPRVPSIPNPKGELQEWLQSSSTHPPHYKTISVTGPDHDREFECIVLHEEQELARGQGKSKKVAESSAALAALEVLKAKQPDTSPRRSRRKRRVHPVSSKPANHENTL